MNKIRQFTGLLISCNIYWDDSNGRRNYDLPDGKDYAKIEIWWDNTKDRNTQEGQVRATVKREMVGEDLWKTIKYLYNENRDYDTFYSMVINESNEVLDFKKDDNLKKLVGMKRGMGMKGREVFELE